jgi:hypothetical protein
MTRSSLSLLLTTKNTNRSGRKDPSDFVLNKSLLQIKVPSGRLRALRLLEKEAVNP